MYKFAVFNGISRTFRTELQRIFESEPTMFLSAGHNNVLKLKAVNRVGIPLLQRRQFEHVMRTKDSDIQTGFVSPSDEPPFEFILIEKDKKKEKKDTENTIHDVVVVE